MAAATQIRERSEQDTEQSRKALFPTDRVRGRVSQRIVGEFELGLMGEQEFLSEMESVLDYLEGE